MSQLTHIVWGFFTIYFLSKQFKATRAGRKGIKKKEDNLLPQKQLFMRTEKTTQKTKKIEIP